MSEADESNLCWYSGYHQGECVCSQDPTTKQLEWHYEGANGIVTYQNCTSEQLTAKTRYPFIRTPEPESGFNQIVGLAEKGLVNTIQEYDDEAAALAASAVGIYLGYRKIKKEIQKMFEPQREEY